VAGQCESRENRLGELNTDLRSFPPSHAATADGCVVKHKIECIGNSDVTFHIQAGAPVRQIADRTIDRRPAALECDACSLESAAARFIPELLLRIIQLFDLPATLTSRGRHRRACVTRQPCAKRAARAGAGPLTWCAPDQGLRLLDSRGVGQPHCIRRLRGSWRTQRLPIIASGL
jgi:hypothetical protein